MNQDSYDRLMQHVSPEPMSGCWIWMGAVNHDGYGVVKSKMAHRIVYGELVGPIPAGLTLDHLCRTRCCVNPTHLEPVSLRENILRGTGPTAQNAKMATCKNGHPLVQRQTGRGMRRFCRICHNARALELWVRRPSWRRPPRRCLYCHGVGARTWVRGGLAHRRCIPKETL